MARLFGLSGAKTEVLYDGFEFAIAPGEIVAVAGPSGAGKSVLLGKVAAAAGRRTNVVRLNIDKLASCDKPALAAVGDAPLEKRLEILSRCGLAEATILVTPANRLSGGQLHRLALAAAITQAGGLEGDSLLIADEFAASLDGATAWVLCRQLRRLIRPLGRAAPTNGGRPSPAVLLATVRGELLEALQPDRVIFKPLGGEAICRPWPGSGGQAFSMPGVIERGSIADYRALSQFHYVAGEPAAHKRVWVVRDLPMPFSGASPWRGEGSGAWPAAVLVVSPPVCNCRGRNAALPRRYTGRNRRAALGRLNREVECISRVVVHPVFRGLRLGVGLVRHALATTQTPLVEALAAMGEIHPLFEKAGMYSFGAFVGNRRYVYYLGRRSPYVVVRPA